MPFEEILPIALKVLGCAIVIFIIGGITAGISRLLPFLAIGAAVGTFFATNYALETGDSDMLWLPIATSVLMQVFYRGSDFMNPRIDQNVYQLVSVERKWNSIFEDFDDYELHFAPAHIGGFIENLIFTGIFYGFYYYYIPMYFPNNWLVHAVTFYVALMSLVDILGIFGIFNFNQFFYGAFRVLVIIIAVTVGFLGPFSDNSTAKRREAVFKQCERLVNFDYDVSYTASYELLCYGYTTTTQDEIYFAYDKDLEAGATYDIKSWGRLYDKVYAKDSRLGNGTYMFQNYYEDTPTYKYIKPAENLDGPFKFISMPMNADFEGFSTFTREKYNHLGDRIYWNDDSKTMSITYNTIYDSSYEQEGNPSYSVTWGFKIDGDRNVTELDYIECTVVKNSSNSDCFYYNPINTGSTSGLETLFDGDGRLQGYTYRANEICGVHIPSVFESLNGVNGSIGDYDFQVKASNGIDSKIYLFDSETKTTAIYENNDIKALNARTYNDFDYYRPDYLVDNENKKFYDSQYNLIGDSTTSRFKYYTFNDASASRAISMSFNGVYGPKEIDARFDYGEDVYVDIVQDNPDLECEISYELFLEKTIRYWLQNVYARFNYEGWDYEITIYTNEDHMDIPTPLPTV